MGRGSWGEQHFGKVYSFKEWGSGHGNINQDNVPLKFAVIRILQNLHLCFNNDIPWCWLNGGSQKDMSMSSYLAPVNVTLFGGEKGSLKL